MNDRGLFSFLELAFGTVKDGFEALARSKDGALGFSQMGLRTWATGNKILRCHGLVSVDIGREVTIFPNSLINVPMASAGLLLSQFRHDRRNWVNSG
jgi:hypothetical protein